MIQLYWRERGNPDNNGEGISLRREDKAYKICKLNNELFPKFEHWYEHVEQSKQEDNEDIDR